MTCTPLLQMLDRMRITPSPRFEEILGDLFAMTGTHALRMERALILICSSVFMHLPGRGFAAAQV